MTLGMGAPSEAVRQLLHESLDFADSVDRWVVSNLPTCRIATDDEVRVFEVLQTTRSFVFFRGAVSLCRAGLAEPAGALLRVLVEHAFVLVAVRKRPELLQKLAHQEVGEKLKAFGSLKSLDTGSRPDWMTNAYIDAAMRSFETPERGGFKAFEWAQAAGLQETYWTLYRRLNTFSHGGLGALAAYETSKPDGTFSGARLYALQEHAPMILVNASSMMLNSVVGLMTDEQVAKHRDEVNHFTQVLEGLNDRVGELVDTTDEPSI